MSIEQLNEQLADGWRLWPHVLTQKYAGFQNQGDALSHAGITFSDLQAAWDISAAGIYNAIAPKGDAFAAAS